MRDYDTYGVESRLTIDHALLGFDGATEIGVRYHEERQARRQWNGDTPNARTPGTSVNAGVRENNERDVNAFSAFIQSQFALGPVTLTPACAQSSSTLPAAICQPTCWWAAAHRAW